VYGITVAAPSGELALSVLLAFGARARAPMGPRLVAAALRGEAPDDEAGRAAVVGSEAVSPVTTLGGGDAEPAVTTAAASAATTAAASAATTAASTTRLAHPVTFLYGSHDWMPADAGAATAEALRGAGVDAACLITSNAGHHLYIEQPELFAAQVLARTRPPSLRGGS
jgi:pimeloyl-ACP methyl ester carboxylesterase